MVKNVDSYTENLKSLEPLRVSSLNEYLNAIAAINNMYTRVIYRGQADKEWEIESSAYRVVKNPTEKAFREYHKRLIGGFHNLHDKENGVDWDNDITLLAHLQHSGAKTGLIDYTHNPLVSL